jgi:hypothetical protein
LARQAALLKDDLLDPVDQLLDDPALVDLVRQCLAKRSPRSTRTGRTGMAPDRRLRCCVMKHLKGWSFPDLERELRSNLVYRRFTHFDAETTPDFTVFSRSFALLSPAVTAEIQQRVVSLCLRAGRSPRPKVTHRQYGCGKQGSLSYRQFALRRRHPGAQPQPATHRQRM